MQVIRSAWLLVEHQPWPTTVPKAMQQGDRYKDVFVDPRFSRSVWGVRSTMDTLVTRTFSVDSADCATGLVMRSVSQPSCNKGHDGFALHLETVLFALEMCDMAAPLAGRESPHLRVSYTMVFATGNKIVQHHFCALDGGLAR
jgi:hypothetical protein